MVWALIAFGVAFFLGSILTLVGGAAVQLMDCPAIFSAFPLEAPSCRSFAGMVFAGAPMAFIGGAAASGILTFGKLPS